MKFIVCGASNDGGQTISGDPMICSESDFAAHQRRATEGTDGNWEIVQIAAHEIRTQKEADADEEAKKQPKLFDPGKPAPFGGFELIGTPPRAN